MAESERVPSPEEIIEVMSASECASLSALSQRAGDGVVALIARLDACREGELMQNFHSVIAKGIAVDYLKALLSASPASEPKGRKRRLFAFHKAVKILKDGVLSETYAKELLGFLLADVKHLSKADAPRVCDAILEDLHGGDPGKGLVHALELVPQLVTRAQPEMRPTVLAQLQSASWPYFLRVKIATILVELCVTEQDTEDCAQAIRNEILMTSKQTLEDTSDSDFSHLVNVMLVLARKASASSKQLVFYAAVDGCEIVYVNLREANQIQFYKKTLTAAVQHFSFALSQDQELCKIVCSLVRKRELGRPPQFAPGVSCWRLMTALLVMRVARYEEKCQQALVNLFVDLYEAQVNSQTCLWYTPAQAEALQTIKWSDLLSTILELIEGPFSDGQIAPSLVKVAVGLSEKSFATRIPPKRLTLLKAVLPDPTVAVIPPLSTSVITSALASSLLNLLFERVKCARPTILRECTSRVGAGAAMSFTYVRVLAHLASTMPEVVAEYHLLLQEAAAALPLITTADAVKLIQALAHVCALSVSVADRCMMGIRKCSFSRDESCRNTAVACISELLQHVCSRDNSSVLAGLSQASRNSWSFGFAGVTMTVEEAMALLRRCLTHQRIVRICVYDQLVRVSEKCNCIKPAAASLLINHFQSYFYPMESSSAGSVDLVACVNETEFILVDCFTELLPAILFTVLHSEPFEFKTAHIAHSDPSASYPECRMAAIKLTEIIKCLCSSQSLPYEGNSLQIHAMIDIIEGCILCSASIPMWRLSDDDSSDSVHDLRQKSKRTIATLSAKRNRLLDLIGKDCPNAEDDDSLDPSQNGKKKPRRKRPSKKSNKEMKAEKLKLDDAISTSVATIWCRLHFAVNTLEELHEPQVVDCDHEEEDIGLEIFALRSALQGLDSLTAAMSQSVNDARLTANLFTKAAQSSSVNVTPHVLCAKACLSRLFCGAYMSLPLYLERGRASSKGTEKKKDNARDTPSSSSELSCTEMCTRIMIGCMRAALWITQQDLDIECTTPDASRIRELEALSNLFADLLQKDVACDETRSTLQQKRDLGEELDEALVLIIKLTKSFYKKGCVKECMVLVSIVCLVVQRQASTSSDIAQNHCLSLCTSIALPPTSLAVIIIRMLLKLCSPTQRATSCMCVANGVKASECHINSESDDEDTALRVIHPKSVHGVCTEIFSVLEKLVSESEQILKQVVSVLADKSKPAVLHDNRSLHDNDGDEEDLEDYELLRTARQCEEQICKSINHGMDVCSLLAETTACAWNASADKFVAIVSKLYKLTGKLVKVLVSRKAKWIGDGLKALMRAISRRMTPRMQEYLTSLLNQKDASAKKMSRQSKIVPDLIFQIEQTDVQLIKLSKIAKDGHCINGWVKRGVARDFRIHSKRIAEVQEEEQQREKDGDQRRKKRKKNANRDENQQQAEEFEDTVSHNDEEDMQDQTTARQQGKQHDEGDDTEDEVANYSRESDNLFTNVLLSDARVSDAQSRIVDDGSDEEGERPCSGKRIRAADFFDDEALEVY